MRGKESPAGTEEWVGAGFTHPDWSNRRNRRANQKRRVMWKLENNARTKERCGDGRTVQECRAQSTDSSVEIKEWCENRRVNRAVGAGFPRPD